MDLRMGETILLNSFLILGHIIPSAMQVRAPSNSKSVTDEKQLRTTFNMSASYHLLLFRHQQRKNEGGWGWWWRRWTCWRCPLARPSTCTRVTSPLWTKLYSFVLEISSVTNCDTMLIFHNCNLIKTSMGDYVEKTLGGWWDCWKANPRNRPIRP